MQLTVNEITKSFGEKQALRGISFTAVSGRPMGLLGRNGAGKTTAMRIIMNVFEPDSGSVLLDGRPLDLRRDRLGYLPEERGLYRKTNVREQLCYFGRLRGLSRADAAAATDAWLERLGLGEYANKKLETLSKGNQQRVQLALTLLNDPEVIILDEPFSGLDPVNAVQLREIVAEQAKKGKLVIFSSHQMGSVEAFCDDIMILNQGRAVVSGTLAGIRAGYPRDRVRLVPAADTDVEALAAAAAPFGAFEQAREGYTVTLTDASRRGELLRTLVGGGFELDTFETVEPTLEEIFVSAAGEEPEEEKDGEKKSYGAADYSDMPKKRGVLGGLRRGRRERE